MSSLLYLSLLHTFSFVFMAPAPTEIYTLSLHDALPICCPADPPAAGNSPEFAMGETAGSGAGAAAGTSAGATDRKSTRLNSSHLGISYAVFCLKKKTKVIHLLSTDRY